MLQLNEKISFEMKNQGINRSDLAKKLGVSKAFITKLLNGTPNLTIKTMAAVSKALNCSLAIDLTRNEAASKDIYHISLENTDMFVKLEETC